MCVCVCVCVCVESGGGGGWVCGGGMCMCVCGVGCVGVCVEMLNQPISLLKVVCGKYSYPIMQSSVANYVSKQSTITNV